MAKFVQRHQSQLYLLPPDLRDWLPEDDLAHFVVEAVERVPLERFQVNERGTGSAQYHPRMMLALLVYCYANGIFGSRRIERATYRDIGVRYVAANCHPDHDTICTFRRSNFEAVAAAFLQVLLLAKELKLLRVGTVSVDGTKVDANANKRNSLRYDRAGALREQLRGESRGVVGSGGARRHGRRAGPAGSAGGVVAAGQAAGEAGPCVRGVGTACAGACGLGAGGVRAQGGGAGAAYGIAQGSAHQAFVLTPWSCRIRLTVFRAMSWPRFASAPRMCVYPHGGFSTAIRHHEVGHLARRYRPASTSAGAAVALPGNQLPVPAENRVRRDDAGDLRENPPAEFLASHRESTALGVGQAKWTWAKLLPEDPILLPEIIEITSSWWRFTQPAAVSRRKRRASGIP